MIAGKEAPCFGEAKNSWLTGTAAWTFVSVAEGLFGIKADFKGLKVDPCIPKSWPGFTATRKYRGVEYQIEVKNPKGVCKGVKSVTVDVVIEITQDLQDKPATRMSGPRVFVEVEVRL